MPISLFRNNEQAIICFDCGATIFPGEVMGRANGNDVCGPCAGDRASGDNMTGFAQGAGEDIAIPVEGTVN